MEGEFFLETKPPLSPSARPRNGMGDKRFPCLTKYRLRTISPTVTTSTRFSAPATSRRCFTILRILRPIKCRPLTLPPTESRQHALEINFSHIISFSPFFLPLNFKLYSVIPYQMTHLHFFSNLTIEAKIYSWESSFFCKKTRWKSNVTIFEHCRNFLMKRRELTIVRCDTGDEDDWFPSNNK